MSSWRNKAYLGVLALLSAFIVISILWHTYDTVQIIRLVTVDANVDKADNTTKAVNRKARQLPLAIFGSHEQVPERVNRSLKLLGVIESTNYRNSRAIIASRNGEGEIYNVGDEISPGLKLHRVFDERVILNRNGVLEMLYMDWGEGVSQPARPLVTPAESNFRNGLRPGFRPNFFPGAMDTESIAERMRELRESGESDSLKQFNDAEIEQIKERLKNYKSTKDLSK